MKYIVSILYFYATLILKLSHCVDTKLLLVQILFRHGDRAPIQFYENDPNPTKFWKGGLGALTLLGKKQHYGLGRYFRSMYQHFTTSSPLEVEVYSADCDRCLLSAEANMASFYAPNKEWSFDAEFPWQPIIVKYRKFNEDKILEPLHSCPRAEVEMDNNEKSPEGQKVLEKYKKLFAALSHHSGLDIANVTMAGYLIDTLTIENAYNLSIPIWARDLWPVMQTIRDMEFYWICNSVPFLRLGAGPFLETIIGNINKKINGELGERKFQIYSAHDTNIAMVLLSLNLFNMKLPPYCASILFELHQMPDTSHAIRILFLNSTAPEKAEQTPHTLILEGCSEFCPVSFFQNYTKHLIPENWEKECQVDGTLLEKLQEEKIAIGWIFVLVLFILLAICGFLIKKFCFTKQGYRYELMPME